MLIMRYNLQSALSAAIICWVVLQVNTESPARPKLHKTLGVVISPTEAIYPSESEWVHMIRLEIPCLQAIIKQDDANSLADMLSILQSMKDVVPSLRNKTNDQTRISTLVMAYRYIRQKNRRLISALKTMQSKTQHVWGIFDSRVCEQSILFKDEAALNDEEIPYDREKRSIDKTQPHHSVYNLPGVTHLSVTHHHYNDPVQVGNSIPHVDQHDEPYRANQVIHPRPVYSYLTTTSTQRPRTSPPLQQRSREIYSDDHYDNMDQELADDPTAAGNWIQSCVIPHLREDSSQYLRLCRSIPSDQGKHEKCSTFNVGGIFDQIYIPGRRRRGLCTACGQFFGWLYGLATEGDVKSLLEAVKGDFQSVVTKVNEGLSQQNVVISTLNETMRTMSTVLSHLSNQTSNIKDYTTQMTQSLKDVQEELTVSKYLDNFSDAIVLMGIHMDSLLTSLHNVEKWYQHLKMSLQSQTIDLDLIPNFSISKLVQDISEKLEPQWMIPPSWGRLKYLRNNMVSVATVDHNIILTIRIPIIKKSTGLTYWRVTTVPHLLAATSALSSKPYPGTELRITKPIVVLDSTNDRWTELSIVEANRCWDRSDQVCDGSVVWRKLDSRACIPSLILTLSPEEVGLSCPVLLEKIHNDIYAAPVDKQHWLVSIFTPSITAYQTCIANSIETTSEVALSGLNLLEIPAKCSVVVGDITMQGYSYTYSNSKAVIDLSGGNVPDLNMTQELAVVFKKIRSALVIPPTANLTHLSVPQINNSLFEDGLVTLSVLRDKLSHLDEIQLLDSSDSKISRFEHAFKNQHSVSLPWWLKLSCGLGGVVVLMVIVGCVKRRFCAPSLATGMIALSNPGRSFALSLDQNSTTTLNSTSFVELLQTLHSGWGSTYHSMLASVSLILMIFCMYKIHHHMYPLIRRFMVSNQVFPLLASMTHHPGEVPITITILCKIHHLFHKETTAEFGIQVGTLPYPATQWYLTEDCIIQYGIKQIINRRWGRFKLQFVWDRMCIKSALVDIETCQAMPHYGSVPWPDVTYQLGNALRWDWVSIQPVSVTTIATGQSHSRRVMKSYMAYN